MSSEAFPADTPSIDMTERVSIRDLMDLLIEICRVAIECGCSSNRVEQLVIRLGEAWGYHVDAAALPTAVWLNAKGRGQHLLELVRVRKWSINLDRLAQLSDLVEDVEAHRMYLDEAVKKLKVLSTSPSPYPRWLTYAAGGGSSVALTYSNGGRGIELFVAVFLGLVCQLCFQFFASDNRRFLAEFFSAMSVALIASIAARFYPHPNLPRLIIGGLISLFPGLVFVNSMHEVAQKNLSSGSARLFEACMIVVNLSFGVAAAIGFTHYFSRVLQ
ncbi:MAG: threonine/serine exporter family protein [Proteobacteria bacterium]|nr:threonine/serine exporter family protein [Pseudomonadota bacterium]